MRLPPLGRVRLTTLALGDDEGWTPFIKHKHPALLDCAADLTGDEC
jgi:hypothetical protein